MNQFRSSPRLSYQDRFDFFSKIRGDIRKSRCTTGFNDTAVANFATSFAIVLKKSRSRKSSDTVPFKFFEIEGKDLKYLKVCWLDLQSVYLRVYLFPKSSSHPGRKSGGNIEH
jgi:hypothetical protein